MGIPGLLLSWILLGGPEPTDTAAVRLTWHAPANCPERGYLEQRIGHHLGRPLATGEQDPAVEISGIVRAPPAEGKQWGLELVITRAGETGSRDLAADTCAELVDAAAFISAVAIDPSVVTREPAPEPPPDPEPEAPSEPEQEPEREPQAGPEERPEPPPPRKRGARGAVGLAGGVGLGLSPRATALLDLRGALLLERARVELAIGHGVVSESTLRDEVGARAWSVLVAATGCFVPRVSTVEFPLCGGARVAAIRATGIGERVTPSPTTAGWLGLEAQAGLAYAPRPFLALFVRGHFGASPTNFAFRVDGAGEVFSPGPLYGGAQIGLEARFGGN